MTNINIFKSDLRNKVKVNVPFINGAWVEFYDDTTVDAVQKAQTAKASQDIADNLQVIVNQIAGWNFADDKGELAITTKTLTRFPIKLIKWLSEEQAKLLTSPEAENEKKNLPVT